MASVCKAGPTLVCVVAIAACSESTPPSSLAPAAEVRVVIATPEPVVNRVEVPARVQAVRTAEVRARVDGIVQRRVYEEGSDVAEGQELFRIDPRERQAAVSAAQATLARAEAALANAEQDVERFRLLVAEQAISAQEFDAAVARVRTTQADVAQARAQLESAELALSYTAVRAPIAGRAGRAEVTEGALVSGASATLLTTIEQLDPIYVNFSQSSADLLRIRREIAQGRLEVPELRQVAATLVLEDGSEYAHTGHLDFLDLAIDQATGTVALRAEFPNPERLLLPGQFVRARIDAGVRPGVILVPQRAVQITPQGAMVMVVDSENAATPMPVTLGELRGDAWIVESGLSGGERVIVSGLQRVQPGQRVTVVAADTAAGNPSRP